MNVAFNKKICGGKITKLEKRKSKLKLSVNWIKNTANYEKNCKILQETVQRPCLPGEKALQISSSSQQRRVSTTA
jgi:hypothetical protein